MKRRRSPTTLKVEAIVWKDAIGDDRTVMTPEDYELSTLVRIGVVEHEDEESITLIHELEHHANWTRAEKVWIVISKADILARYPLGEFQIKPLGEETHEKAKEE